MAKMKINHKIVENTVKRCREQNITIPTFKQMRNPNTIPDSVKARVKKAGLWDFDPVNLYRITWKNDRKTGLYGDVNYLEIPREITGIKARVIGLVGKYFPTGAHKVGAAFGCLVPRLVSGEFDPTTQKAVWPSTGNYCRGGAFDSVLLGCHAVAILPEGMSRERFEWLKTTGAEIIATPGTESNVKEIYDECWNIRTNRPDCVIFNQFAEMGNPTWHYNVTGPAIEEVFNKVKGKKGRLAGYCSATGSAGTIAAGDYLKKLHPGMKILASEALQCPTIYMNGFGEHRIEGIGDKHIPWVHNVRNTDMVAAIDDENCMRIIRLFNEPAGKKTLVERYGVPQNVVDELHHIGISGASNMLSAIKMAKYLELDENDVIFTIFTDSMELYHSRIAELNAQYGKYNATQAAVDMERYLLGVKSDYTKELNYYDRKAVHNLKYFTWVEQQGKDSAELRRQWDPEYWEEMFGQADEWDKLIADFNRKIGK